MWHREVEKVLLWTVKIGLWIIPFLPLYVSASMLFPFITGKNFAFRIITEVLFVLWVGLAVANPQYRPRLTWIFKAVTVFIGVLFLADLLSPNPYRAFFANYERMEGFMMLGHLYLYFVMLVSVFKSRRDWLVFFHTTLAASVLVSYVALLQKFGYRVSVQGGFRVDATIGNPTYLAAYLLFHVGILAILIRQFWHRWALAIWYGALAIFELVIVYFTATRGAVIGFFGVAILLLALVVLFWRRIVRPVRDAGEAYDQRLAGGQSKMRRGYVGIALVLLVILPFVLWRLKDTEFVRSNSVLYRLTQYSFSERTIQSRFSIWNMSWQGALERPLLGWGQENYYLVFQKYYDPALFSSEPWFDRSHNVVFDWLIHSGFLGLLSYMGVFAVVFWQLAKRMRDQRFPFLEGLLVMGVFLMHVLQNIFVFDNLNTYLLFFAFLSYADFLSLAPGDTQGKEMARGRNKMPTRASLDHPEYAYVASAALLMAVAVGGYFLHLKPIRQSKAIIKGLFLQQRQAPLDQVTAAFREAVGYNSFGTTEAREQLSNVARSVAEDPRIDAGAKKQFMEFVLEEMRKETSHPAKDVKHLLFLGALLNRATGLDPAYREEAARVLGEAVRVSPAKQIVYFEVAQMYLSAGDIERTTEALRKAWLLDKRFSAAAVNLLTIGLLQNKPEVVAEVTRELDLKTLDEQSLYQLGTAYQRVNKFDEALNVYEVLVPGVPRNAQYRATYAALLAQAGKKEEARREVEEAVRLDPNFEKEAKVFLEMLQTK